MGIAIEVINKQNKTEMLRRALERIIQLYTDKSHFVYELLQNAEDSGATSIRFEQFVDRLEVYHNGKPFTVQNLSALCDIGKSDKVNDLNQIGEFGVGFKSVFGICETVKLYSDPSHYKNGCEEYVPFAIEIRDFTNPKDIEQTELPNDFTTKFIFPYAVNFSFSGFKTKTELNRVLSKRLKNLGITTLLFMKNLEVIEYRIVWEGKEEKGKYLLDKTKVNDHCTLVSALGSSNEEEESISYLTFSRPIKTSQNTNRTIDIAFPVKLDDNGNYNFQKTKYPFISVYFPTETESKLNFIVQGPYRTTPNRSSVPADDEENLNLADQTLNLYRDSLLELRDLGKFNMSLLRILPIQDEAFESYALFKGFYEETKDILLTQKILPTKNGGYTYEVITDVSASGTKGTKTLFKNARLPHEIRSRFPEAGTFGKKNQTYEEIRKLIVLLGSYIYWYEVQHQNKRVTIDDYISEMNEHLFNCGYPLMYYGNPFDWLFMWCSLAERPLDTFRGIVSEVLAED